MPNAPKTPTRTFRCPDDRWNAARAKADEMGITLTKVLNDALEAFLADEE